jgi:hypothetical protein
VDSEAWTDIGFECNAVASAEIRHHFAALDGVLINLAIISHRALPEHRLAQHDHEKTTALVQLATEIERIVTGA